MLTIPHYKPFFINSHLFTQINKIPHIRVDRHKIWLKILVTLSTPLYISRSKYPFILNNLSHLKQSQTKMASTNASSLLFLLLSFLIACTIIASPTNFIKSSCSTTQYPALCVDSLSVYASTIQQDPHQLVQTALSLSLNKTESTKAFVTKCNKFRGLKPREYAALKDCAEEISDSVDRLSKSLKELKLCKTKGEDFTWHISNVETWVSSALTDESTCGDGFAGKVLNGKIKDSIRARMVNVAQVTSNALSLINQYAAKN